jgi:hypothetical protein
MRPHFLAATCMMIAWGAILAAGACGGAEVGPTPVPTLASSPQAAVAFDEIREEWGDPNHDGRWATLRQLLERFLVRFPSDGIVPLARIYLALVAMEQGDFATADKELAAVGNLRPGTAHDLSTVARARSLRLRGHAEAALALLRPLVGKNVDPVNRAIFEEELTLTALATHRDYEAISYMDAWLRASSDEDRSQTIATVSALAAKLSTEVLVGALQAMRRQRGILGYGTDIERILADRLATLATEKGDAVLARLLLDPDGGSIAVAGKAAVELSALATSQRGLDIVDGRTIGLLLPTESPELRDEAADVLRGVMWALGLPRGVRSPPTHPLTTDALPSARGAVCAPLEPAPALDDPRVDEGLRLVTRDDVGSTARTEVSLDELAGEGAAVIIAALDPQTAERAKHWAENRGVAMILLVPPERRDDGTFGFVLGESRARVIEVLAETLKPREAQRFAPIIDSSELALYAPQGGRLGPLAILPPISCDIPATRAGEPRFPIAEWDHGKTHAWLVSGSPSCALDVVAELSSAQEHGVVALTLEAAVLPPHNAGLRVVSASAGVVPAGAASDMRDDELQRFSVSLGNVSWWTALGRDAATIARVSVDELPTDRVTESRAVATRRLRANDLLSTARARLWTTESAGWTAGRTLKRTVCAIDAPPNK